MFTLIHLTLHLFQFLIFHNLQRIVQLQTFTSPSISTSSNHTPTFHSASSPHISSDVQPVHNLRKSTRNTKLPSYLQDFVHSYKFSYCTPTTCACTLSNFCQTVKTQQFPSITCCNVVSISSPPPVTEPTSYEEAIQFPEWRQAITAEFSALEANKTW